MNLRKNIKRFKLTRLNPIGTTNLRLRLRNALMLIGKIIKFFKKHIFSVKMKHIFKIYLRILMSLFWFYRKGNCKNVTMGLQCEVGLRKKTYNVLTGSVLSVWHEIESILTHDGNRKGTNSRMQVNMIWRIFFWKINTGSPHFTWFHFAHSSLYTRFMFLSLHVFLTLHY